VILAILCEAGYTLMGKALTKNFPPIEIAAFSALIGFIGFIPFALWQYEPVVFQQISAKGWFALVWYGIGTMGVGSVLWYKGVKKVSGSTAAAFMGVMPVSALLLSYLLLDEFFRWIHLAGFLFVFIGVILVIRSHQKGS
jgi:drug/metabolite transporter (DMT)-like permease